MGSKPMTCRRLLERSTTDHEPAGTYTASQSSEITGYDTRQDFITQALE